MLDYDYVAKCDKLPELKAILGLLRSGKEGKYPHLERTVEKKVLETMPDAERKKVLSMRQQATRDEVEEEKRNLSEWLGEMNVGEKPMTTKISTEKIESPTPVPVDDDDIFGADLPPKPPTTNNNTVTYNTYVPPIRGTAESSSNIQKKGKKKQSSASEEENKENQGGKPRLNKESMSNRDYFRAWDAFDVDEEEKALDEADATKAAEIKERKQRMAELAEKNRQRRLAEIEDLREKMSYDNMSEADRKYTALREKNKGNECFRAGENDEAVLYVASELFEHPVGATTRHI